MSRKIFVTGQMLLQLFRFAIQSWSEPILGGSTWLFSYYGSTTLLAVQCRNNGALIGSY